MRNPQSQLCNALCSSRGSGAAAATERDEEKREGNGERRSSRAALAVAAAAAFASCTAAQATTGTVHGSVRPRPPIARRLADKVFLQPSSGGVFVQDVDSTVMQHLKQQLVLKLHTLRLSGRKPESLGAPLSPSHDNSTTTQPRRCLKSAPQTPTKSGQPKKIVKFADDMGLDLTAVKVMVATPPSQSPEESATTTTVVPCATKEPVKPAIVHSKEYLPARNIRLEICQSTGRYQAKFEQPGATPNFWNRVRAQKVCLESVIASYNSSVHIVIRVVNVAFHKRVLLRYTLNNWGTFTDLEADYMPECKDLTNATTDRFSVNLCLKGSPRSVQFCVCYQVDGKEYWDNNNHQNYRMEFEENQQPTPFY